MTEGEAAILAALKELNKQVSFLAEDLASAVTSLDQLNNTVMRVAKKMYGDQG